MEAFGGKTLSPSHLLLSFAIFFILSIYVQRWYSIRIARRLGGLSPAVKIGGPLGLGFFWMNIKTWRNNSILEFWESIFEDTGCTERRSYTAEVNIMNGQRMILTADPENVKAVLSTNFKSWGKGQILYENFKHFLGDGVLSIDGEKWQKARQIIRPFFEKSRVTDLDLYERNMQRLIPILSNNNVVEIDDLIFRYTMDAISDFLLGAPVGSLENKSNGFTEAFNNVQRVQSVIMRSGPLGWAIPKKTYYENIKRLDEYIAPYLTRALAGDSRAKEDTFLHALSDWTRDPKTLRDEITSMLFAGSDTTASALSWIFFELARNPRVVTKLRAIILEEIGSTRRPTYEELKDMKYLHYIINETQRLHTTMPFATRQALQDTTLPRGGGPDGLDPVGIRAGTSVIYSALLMHRRRDLYPPESESFPDPLKWVPERWENWNPKSWQLIPFSGGPRICMGKNYAITQMSYTLVRLLQTFDRIVDYTGGGPPVLKYGMMLTPFDPVKVAFLKPREKIVAGTKQ